MDRFDKSATSTPLKEEYRVNWKIANFSEIRGSKEALEAETHRFEMGSSIELPTKLKCYLTSIREYGRMWICPVVALDEKPGGNLSELFATLQVEVNEGSMFRGDIGPMANLLTDSVTYSPLLPQVYLPFEAEFRNYVNADGSLDLSLIVNLYNFENSSSPPYDTLYNSQLKFEQKCREKLQENLSKLFQNPESLSQNVAMAKVVSSDDKEFFVNPDILAARCPDLYSMLADETSSVLTFPDISGKHLETILGFVHTATLPLNWKICAETTDELVYVAKKFGVMDLVEFLEDSRRFSVKHFD